ncbi:MAG: hypothetical protein LBQ50_14395 [Planctomycetaceae bacterium]|jgi:hypothetical protein|nr:hypothetical protein [Planctomycetaceae bacterium]
MSITGHEVNVRLILCVFVRKIDNYEMVSNALNGTEKVRKLRHSIMKINVVCLLFFVIFVFGATLFAIETEQKLIGLTFETDVHGWQAERFCRAILQNKALCIQAVGGSPFFSRLIDVSGGQMRVVVELRTSTVSTMTASWTTQGSPRRSNDKMITLSLDPDGLWHSYEFAFPISDRLMSFAFQFSAFDGTWEIKSFTVYRRSVHPLKAIRIVPYHYSDENGNKREMLRYTIQNNASIPLAFQVGNQPEELKLQESQSIDLGVPIKTEGNLSVANLKLCPKEFPEIDYSVFLYKPEGKTDWISKKFGNEKTIEIAPDARMARIWFGDKIVAIIAPIVHRQGVIPVLALESTEMPLRFKSPDTELEIRVENESLRFLIEDKTVPNSVQNSVSNSVPLESPVVRIFGTLQSGLLPGVEFLGAGDVSSSAIDIEEPYNDRSEPNPLWITMPMALLGTDQGSVMLRWNNMKLQPRLASPNHFDRTDDHRISLMGSSIDVTLDFWEPTGDLAVIQALRRYFKERGLPEPLAAPRSSEEQRLLHLQALRGVLQMEDGLQWGYAAEPEWQRKSFADMLSTLVRLEEAGHDYRLLKPTEIVSGGADIANDAIYFLTGRIEEWKKTREDAVQSILVLRNPDGSFLHRTRFTEVEASMTSFGYTAIRTLEIMELVRLTGNRELFEKIRQSLDYLKRCDVPRGGFYRDTPLHTPDLLTAATLVWLYTWAFEFSGEPEYLERAKRFALMGLPFVYQWSDRENMLYVTVSKLGGTERRLPHWFGVSQTRVGIVFAYALNLLSRYDSEMDWKRPAIGILHAVEKIQYADGSETGCVPDLFNVMTQERRSWKVNPCALVSLRWAIENKTDSLFVLTNKEKTERYVSPYPLRRTTQGIEAYDVPADRKFQILHNGNRIGKAEGNGLVILD